MSKLKTISIVATKGGASKTTLAIHLAVAAHLAGYDTGLLDMDPQGTSETWGGWRDDKPPAVIGAKAATLTRTIEKAEQGGGEIVVIDTPPVAQAEARAAAACADLILVPCQLRIFDLDAIKVTAGMVKDVNKPAYVVFTRAPHNATSLYAEGKERAEALGLKVAPVMMVERGDYHHAPGQGQAAQEYRPAGKAAYEVSELWSWVCKELGIAKSRSVISKSRKKAG